MLNDYWPLAQLKLATKRLELRVPNDDELSELAQVAAIGVHEPGQQPFLTPWTDLPPRERALYVMQQHWSRRGMWCAEDWALEMGVFHADQPVGMVTLKARNFSVLREVKTESWLGLEFHRQGIGTEARTALLSFAFERLGAVTALTEVFQDNVGSQGVSRRLGYRPDGTSRDVLAGRVVVSDRLRLDVSDWATPDPTDLTVTGLAEALPFFSA
ncbi:GNAT family N-acetyltransferase [Arthrobacter psychrolactophilus]|uniref:GNAT family N-acetyltransferase n=1 Tax=Arthrobacter psychrolactophilus TaxID=92442 RepID=A0A2V5IKD3_9MICC|nr:GNAT family protein [Arthrobacter psychrolactophilus]PYI37128.1 GNAT family N-acetyltransferase [Arthrobacter psychrolactophilus]